MVGSAIVRELQRQGYTNIITRTHKELDLLNQAAVNDFFASEKPEYVFLAAAHVDVRIAVICFFCALVVGFDSANLRPLVFFESQNGILGVIRQQSLLFCHTMS